MQDILANPWCRVLLSLLESGGESTSVAALAHRVASHGRHDEVGPSEKGSGQRETTPTKTREHVRAHARAMARLGILGYDPDADAVWIPADVALSVRPPGDRSGPTSTERDVETQVSNR